MSEPPDDLDDSVVFASLAPKERALVRGWCKDLAVDPDAWASVPPIRSLVVSVLMARYSAEILREEEDITSRKDALVSAAQALGAPLGWAPAEAVGRRLRRWRARAGESVRDSDSEAA